MNEIKCPNCEKVVPQTVGKRLKQFCNNTCRSSFWQKEKRKQQVKNTQVPFDGSDNKRTFIVMDEVGQWEENFFKPIAESETGNLVWANEKKDKVIFEPNKNGAFKMFIPASQPIIDKYGNADEEKIEETIENYREIQKQIAAIEAEQIPKERDTKLGRLAWESEKQNRINQLKKIKNDVFNGRTT